jgi:FixJ family two-component response regulator
MRGASIVYVLDDDADVRDGLKALFESVGLRCEVFGSAAQFLTRNAPEVVSCLVLEVRLPGLSGLDVQAQLGESQISNSSHFHHRVRGHSDGGQGHEGWSCRIPLRRSAVRQRARAIRP